MSHDESLHPDRMDGSRPEAPPLGPYAWWADEGTERPRIWDKPGNVKKLLIGFYAVCTILVLLDLVIDRVTHHPWEPIFGFYAWYGFAACWMLVVIAKQMRRVLMRSEDYYDVD